MKKLLLLLLISLSLPHILSAQDKKEDKKKNRKEIRNEQRRLQAIIDSVDYVTALRALDTHQWAFEARDLRDKDGQIIQASTPQPNVAGYDGERFFGHVIETGRSMYSLYTVVDYTNDAKLVSKKIGRKGTHVYTYQTYGMGHTNVIVALEKGGPYASISFGGATYNGKILPITKSWYFMTYQREKKKERRKKNQTEESE